MFKDYSDGNKQITQLIQDVNNAVGFSINPWNTTVMLLNEMNKQINVLKYEIRELKEKIKDES